MNLIGYDVINNMYKNEMEAFMKLSVNETIPVAPLKIVALSSCKELGNKVDKLIVEMRKKVIANDTEKGLNVLGFDADSYILDAATPRFGSGEAKGIIYESVRGKDLYLIVDVVNSSLEYTIGGQTSIMSPDDHYADLKRIIAACNGKAHRINVIMPFLYESRQHRRSRRESLDCALALQELVSMGVDNIITFDAHDPRVQNAIPIKGFDNFFTSYQFINAFINCPEKPVIDKNNLMVISPDEGGMSRAVYYANVLGVDMGMFYKRRDYSKVVNGKNPIVAHEFLGNSLDGKDVFIVDDMIASGESMIDVARELKARKAGRVFVATTFGLFTEGLEKFDKAVEEGIITRVFTTNLIYTKPEVFERSYYTNVDLSKYIALIIDTLNHDLSVNDILNPSKRIQELLKTK